jgi:hypothetical protein
MIIDIQGGNKNQKGNEDNNLKDLVKKYQENIPE